uniref:Large ribosomal subunit protein uL18 C-terminal eukaryotes domain-containing protein n=1 Tax=Trieres chinensis TaxID=1514140 RepID=A0A7S1YV59_TRICV|mmetsp:Transcript_11447/g.23932  ORF Transcript_11447/g.23932 Transcript_11447/m.23932 type:complete len:307 (+) Transcript_11447:107-1027(+)|eukprot:CAMPEP_0183327366 /NCGR_PEP_ID=MMETSP0160_2-20130417/83722_1 /TAXON_ID=2839 ORGANISM="Odontella Sinensis, Strain Grunow 1884" /NCGR_SAMPLE_ID=MMETSP0160_2 /ASSEMBLY_ACC=CAM_ASM_000250 /LENGTH=306 /DNA_ID=CAMNT_0025495491 /DNA_START=99 /DNA_END=1019 /DNA_ORIENTATION=+
MGFVKVQHSKAYSSRYQVKYRRRREGCTDYRQRRRLCTQDKNKYQSPKYRLVVRFTNRKVICQIAYSLIDGDRILCQANSDELPRYGLEVGLKNYAAAYCTGLLVARRLLQKVGLDETYEGNTEVDGEIVSTEVDGKKYYVDEVDEDKRPFRCLLDVGCRPTTTGCRIFGALKGAADGGLDIPHTEKRFPGYDRDSKEYDADMHKERIFGGHVGEYMEYLEEEDNQKYQECFAKYIENDVEADGLEELYEGVHEAIREDPSPSEKKDFSPDNSYKRKAKLTLEERKARVQAKKDAKKAELEESDEE